MENLKVKIIKWLIKGMDYKFVMVKITSNEVIVEGNKDFLRYNDVFGYTTKNKPNEGRALNHIKLLI